MTNILECYLIILKNNEELLNRRMADLNHKDINLKQKEYIINKILRNKNDSYKILYGTNMRNFFTLSSKDSKFKITNFIKIIKFSSKLKLLKTFLVFFKKNNFRSRSVKDLSVLDLPKNINSSMDKNPNSSLLIMSNKHFTLNFEKKFLEEKKIKKNIKKLSL